MNFHFPLMPRIYMALAKADRTPVEQIIARTPPIPANCQWGTFLRCHDELTLEMVTPEEREFMWNFYAPEPRMRLNLGIRRRLAPLMGNDRRKVELMNSMLFTLPGSPVLYYGDEIGMGDNIYLEDRNGVRTPMQWSASTNAGFSSAARELLYAPPIEDPDFGFSSVNVESQRSDRSSLLWTMKRMIAARKKNPVLATGRMDWLQEIPNRGLCFWRTEGETRFLALHNLSDEPLPVRLPGAGQYRSVLEPEADPVHGQVDLPPFGYLWLTPV
jgi:maltose alpha-D-glucosyltransferase/alpha-amylase